MVKFCIVVLISLFEGVNGTPIACCNSKLQHPECFPVFLKSDDPHYSKFNLSCMEFARSAPALRCSFGENLILLEIDQHCENTHEI